MKRISKSNKPDDAAELPPDVKAADTKYLRSGNATEADYAKYRDLRNKLSEIGFHDSVLTFYRVKGLGWVLTTLHISNASRRQAAGTPSRTYAIGIADSKVYTVGRGPHVEKTVVVYLTPDNIERLQKYVDLWKKGMEDAGAIRDRISSRRAQGQLHRAAGESSWMW